MQASIQASSLANSLCQHASSNAQIFCCSGVQFCAAAGALSAPTAPLTESLTPSWVWKTVVPQTGQNLNTNFAPWSPTRTYSVAAPEILNGARQLASVANALPILFWQARQWQTLTPRGSPST